MAQGLGGKAIAVAIGAGVEAVAKDLGQYGADKVIVVDNAKLKDFTVDAYGKAFSEVVSKNDPAVVLLYHVSGKDLGGYASAASAPLSSMWNGHEMVVFK
jgi:electron transfer flavoprotein alpha subunit